MPTKNRNTTSLLISYRKENILVDCGEGTQKQIRRAGISPAKITRIFISHWHGDHVLGLPGLIQTMSAVGYEKTLRIYGPAGTKKFMKWNWFDSNFLAPSKKEHDRPSNHHTASTTHTTSPRRCCLPHFACSFDFLPIIINLPSSSSNPADRDATRDHSCLVALPTANMSSLRTATLLLQADFRCNRQRSTHNTHVREEEEEEDEDERWKWRTTTTCVVVGLRIREWRSSGGLSKIELSGWDTWLLIFGTR